MSNLLTDIFDMRPHGRLTFDVFHRGNIIEHFDDCNLIVDGSKLIHAHLLGGDVTNRSVTKIGFGTNINPPVVGNTSLSSPFIKNIDSVSYPADNKVQFNFSLLTSENNGMSICELGLLTTGGALYARKARTVALPKTVDISITGFWIITFP